MRWIPVAVLLAHGLIHLIGPAKAFGYAVLPQLTQPVSRASGLVWLAAALLMMTTAALLAAGARTYWIPGALGLVLSQAAIVSAWGDGSQRARAHHRRFRLADGGAAKLVAIPVLGACRRYLWAAVLIGVVLVECGVLAANRGRCPLTDLAAEQRSSARRTSTSMCPCGSPKTIKLSSARCSSAAVFSSWRAGGGLNWSAQDTTLVLA